MDFWNWLLEWRGIFLARAECGAWTPEHILISKVANLIIAASYTLIPFIVLIMYKSWKKVPLVAEEFRIGVILFTLFIFSCGISHLFGGVIVFDIGFYRLITFIDCICALASLTTVIYLVIAPGRYISRHLE